MHLFNSLCLKKRSKFNWAAWTKSIFVSRANDSFCFPFAKGRFCRWKFPSCGRGLLFSFLACSCSSCNSSRTRVHFVYSLSLWRQRFILSAKPRVKNRVRNFRQKNNSAEDGIDGTNVLFRRNSGFSAEQKILGIPFWTIPWNRKMFDTVEQNRSKLSEFHSEPFRGREKCSELCSE